MNESRTLPVHDAVGKTIAAVGELYDRDTTDGYGESILVMFTDGTSWEIWGCGCCGSPTDNGVTQRDAAA